MLACEDEECPELSQSVLDELRRIKKSDPSRFVSHWEKDEEDINLATDEQILNDPVQRILWAAETGKMKLVEEMLERDGSLVNARDDDGYTPLHRASYEGHIEVIKCLLGQGADICAVTEDGWQPLHSACKWNIVEAATTLINHGAKINAQTRGGQTPLHLAATNEDNRDLLILLLMNKDVDFTIKNSVGETAYDLCCRSSKNHYLFEMTELCCNKLR